MNLANVIALTSNIDVQFALDELTSAADRRALTEAYHHAWRRSHVRYFKSRAISSMSQTPSNLFTLQLASTATLALPTRNSDDFFPDVPASHPWHIFCNAHNALFTAYLNVLPDWDMFQTLHPWAAFHAAARCLSGGPIYITDEPGKHDTKLIQAITASTPALQRVVLRPSVAGRSGNVYVGLEEQALVRICAYNGDARSGVAFVGLFNCHENGDTMVELVHPSEFMGIEASERYVVRGWRSGKVGKVMCASDALAIFGVELDSGQWEMGNTPIRFLSQARGWPAYNDELTHDLDPDFVCSSCHYYCGPDYFYHINTIASSTTPATTLNRHGAVVRTYPGPCHTSRSSLPYDWCSSCTQIEYFAGPRFDDDRVMFSFRLILRHSDG